MDLPLTNAVYKKQNYWDERYKEDKSFDWFAEYSVFRDHIVDTLDVENKLLTLGCGNSTLSEEMYADGFHNIINTDYSPVVIENMREKCAHLKKMTWEVVDVKCLDSFFEEEQFDAVIEKGTLDALMVDEKDPWNISEEADDMMDGILSQVSRILEPNGHFISISFAQPHFRKQLYAKTKFGWSVETRSFGDTFHYFVYVMRKGQSLSQADKESEGQCEAKKRAPSPEVVYLSDSDDENFMISKMTLGQEEEL